MPNIYDVASAIQQPNIVGNIQAGQQFAQQNQARQMQLQQAQQQQEDQSQLRSLAPQIISGDPNAYAQAAAIDPQAAQQYQGAGDEQLKRIQGAISYIDQQQTPQAKEAAYQQVRPYLARFGQEPPATFAEAEPKMEAARAQIAMLGQQQKKLMNIAAGGTAIDEAGNVVYHNPGVPAKPDIIQTDKGFARVLPDGTVVPLSYGGAPAAVPAAMPAAPSGQAITPNSPSVPNAAAMANALLAHGMPPEQVVSAVNASMGGLGKFDLKFDSKTGQFVDVSDGSEKFPSSSAPGGAVLPAPKPETPQRETFSQPQQVIGPDGKPKLVQFGTLGTVRPVEGDYVKPEMTPAQAAKAAVQQQKAEESKSDAVASYDQSINQIDALLNSPGASMLGTFSGDIAGMIPHSDTANANAALDNIKNQVLLNTIAKLKALSATGASGFGSLSNQEGEILKNSIASLDKKQSNQQLLYNLRQIKGLLQQSRDRIAGKSVEFGDSKGNSPDTPSSTANDISDLLEKYK